MDSDLDLNAVDSDLDSDLKALDLDLDSDLDFLISARLGLKLGLDSSGLGPGLGYWWTCYKSAR